MTLSVSSFFRVLFPGVFDVRTWHLPGLILKNTLPLFLHSPAKKLFHYKKAMYCWQPLFSMLFILAMHFPKCQQQSQEGRKALSWCRQSTFRPFLSLRCNLLSQRSFVSIVRLLAISFFNVSKLHFYLLRFITPTKELCINCQGGLSSGHHCDCTALCFHNISCFELVIIRSFCQFLHRTPRCSRNNACFF